MHLGDFGAAVKELDPNAEKDSFTFFGEKFEIVDDLPPMLIFQLAASMTGKVDETEGMAAMWEALRVSLGDDGFSRLYKSAVAKRADIQSLMELVMSLFQASGGERPTVQVPDSPAGQLPTSPSSSTSASTPQDSGEIPPAFLNEDRDPSVPHLVPVSRVLAG
jgi:hypothetical protein